MGNVTSHTVALGSHNDEDRRQATTFSGNTDNPSFDGSQKKVDEKQVIMRYMKPGEVLLWRRSISKGIVNRHLAFTEFVTNLKAACIDDEHLSLVRCVFLLNAVIATAGERRVYNSTRSGLGERGAYLGAGTGSSVTYGEVEFFVQGKPALTLFNVRDPNGLKRLIEASLKSSNAGQD